MPAEGIPACILVRHAHAEWPAYRGRDFDRPLTEKGLRDARATGLAIRAAGLAPDRIIASAARRTEQTATLLAQLLELPAGSLQLQEALYNADAPTLQDALLDAARDGGCVMLVAHNPGISELARLLSGGASVPPFRPAEWRAFGAATAGQFGR